MSGAVTDNAAASRFELAEDGAVAFAEYRVRDGQLVFTHTEVPDSLSGRGVGSRLAKGALGLARARGLPVVAECPFIAGYIRKHPEFQDLLAG
ncbi:GNAT family N-acetyltransferase [Azospirillum sp.]|uniref:GNAT family N-acetyltransferase n=1 Tax=Azospirillum sp. TaxID=34012 RepID=UPI003D719E0F